MAEAGDFELFGDPQAKEASEQSDEQFNDEMRQAQTTLKQLRKEEGKARGHDDRLAQIIVQFLAQPANTDLFLLISRCVAQNIPSEIIIAVLSLVDRTASEEIVSILKDIEKGTAMSFPQHDSIHSLSGGQKQAIDDWIGNIVMAAAGKPHRALETILIRKTDEHSHEIISEISAPFVQLSAFIMRNYLAMQNTHIEYEKLHDFIQSVYLKMIQDIEEMAHSQKKLS